MSTRFYFAPTDTPPISPAVSSGWEQTPATIPRGTLKPHPESRKVLWAQYTSGFVTGTKSSATQPWDMLAGQFISRPLPAAGTLNGTANLVGWLTEAAATNDIMMQVIIRVLSGDGSTVRGTAYAGQTNTAVSATQGAINEELPVAGAGLAAGSRIMTALALSSVAYQAGDRIVVEVGVRSTLASAAGSATLTFSDSNDLPLIYDLQLFSGVTVSSTPDANAPALYRAWIEFSADLFIAPGTEEFKFKDDGIILNSSPSLPFVDITNVEGLDMAGVRLNQHDREGIHGGYVSSEFETSRTITIEGNIYANPSQLETYLDQLKENFAPTRRDQKFYFGTDAGVRMVWGKSQGLRYNKDAYRRLGLIPFQVQISCADPRIYGAEVVVSENMQSALVVNATLTPGGNRDTPGVVRVYGPSTGSWTFTLVNLYGNLSIAGLALSATEFVTIDLDKRTIVKNYTQNVRGSSTVSGSWISLFPGVNKFGITALGSGKATITYRPAWR